MSYRRKLDTLEADHRAAVKAVKAEQADLMECDDALTAAEEARDVIQSVAQAMQQEIHGRVSSLVSRCLETVFDDPYEFKIVFERKRGRTEASLVFIRRGLTLTDPLREVGGGVIDVASLALRIASILLTRPPSRRLLVLDEPFQRIRGIENRKRIRDLLVSLADDFGFQIILNIDIDAYPEFALGKLVELS
jgi:ABC-type Mn2+/Zn2+ transport system ATPase subunit